MTSFILLYHTRQGIQPLAGRWRISPKQQQLIARNICHPRQCLKPEQQFATRRYLSRFAGTASAGTRARRPPRIEKEVPSHDQPPFPARVLLVGSATALGTPVFPAIGFFNLVLRVMLPEPQLRAQISASIGSILSFSWMLVPAFYSIAPAILPCAIGNGIVAGATYGLIDIASGGPTTSRVLRNPLAGGFVGAATGFVAPYFCYGPLFSAMYGMEGITDSIQFVLAYPLASQVTIATGFVAGVSMYPLLYFPVNGIQGVHWMNFTLPVLTATALALCYVYSPDERLYVPEGSFIEPGRVPLMNSILRYDIKTGEIRTYSISTGDWVGPAELRREGEQLANSIRQSNDPTFDDRVVAWLDSYTFVDAASKYPDRVVNVHNKSELEAAENLMLQIDGIVSLILERSKNDQSSFSGAEERLVQVMGKMDDFNQRRRNESRKWKEIDEIEAASIAVELLLILKQINNETETDRTSALMKDAESYIQRKNPNLVIFVEDEEVPGESMESQLILHEWNGASDIATAIDSFQRISNDDKWQRVRNRTIQVGTILLSIAAMSMMNHGSV